MRNINYFDYKTLANPHFITPKHFSSVCHYGNYRAVTRLKNSRFNFITEYLEHGVSFFCEPESVKLGGYVDRPFLKRIYTYGSARKSTLEAFCNIHNLKRKVIAIGPYIKGAEFFKTKEELDSLKQKYGRILLIFPSHSIKTMHVKYDEATLMQEVFRIRNDFDTIFICLYWKDILDERRLSSYEKYISDKIKIVSAGHSSDPRFLSRLKDLIWLSDITMSNNIGTHLGYSICLEKPHYLFNQVIEYIANGSNIIDSNIYPDISKFYDLFRHYPASITSEQIALVERYWGKW